ncbi:MAG TPA: F0F1 ATP synthase subunit delta [Candidatus Paceibacterota bacterium]
MERQYAEALLAVIEKGMTPREAVIALKKTLENRGRLFLLPKIAKAFERLAAKEANKNTLTLTVARQKDARKALSEVQNVLAEIKTGDVDLCETVDESLIGGWRLEGKGHLVDQSWKRALLSIYNLVTK